MKKKIFTAIFIIYLLVVFRITVFRSSFWDFELFSNGEINLNLFSDLIDTYKNSGIFTFIYLFVGNIVWFIPAGFLIVKIFGSKCGFFKTVLSVFLISFIIETMQYIFGTGVSETDDLILNTLGGIIGYFFAVKIPVILKRGKGKD